MRNSIRCFQRQLLGVTECNQNCLGRQYSKRCNVRWFQRVEDNLYIFTLAKHTPGDFSGSIQHQGQRMVLKMNREKNTTHLWWQWISYSWSSFKKVQNIKRKLFLFKSSTHPKLPQRGKSKVKTFSEKQTLMDTL